MKPPKAMLVLFFASLLFFSPLALAAQVIVSSPAQSTAVEGSVVDLGVVGPGQKVEIAIESGTGQQSILETSKEAIWDQLNVLPESLPSGWGLRNALIYGANKTAQVIVGKDAPQGEYRAKLQAIDEYQGTPAVVFEGKITVSEKVLQLDVVEDPVRAQVNESANYKLRLKNTANAADAFVVTVAGIPGAQTYSAQVYLPMNSEKTIDFGVSIAEQGEYAPAFTATSLSSERIKGSANAKLLVGATLMQELKAAGRGMLLFPSAEQAVIYALGFLANALGAQ